MGKTLATLLLAAGLGGCSLSSKLPATDTADLTQGKNLVYVMPRTKQEGIRASYFDPNVGKMEQIFTIFIWKNH